MLMNISVKNLILRSYHDLTEPHKYRHNYAVTGLTRPGDPCLRYFVFIRPCQLSTFKNVQLLHSFHQIFFYLF